MSLTENGGGMYMPVAPAYGGGNGGFGWGGDWAWILLLLLIGGNGWGMGGFGGWGGAMMGMDYGLYPWLNNSQHISDGLRRRPELSVQRLRRCERQHRKRQHEQHAAAFRRAVCPSELLLREPRRSC